MRARQITCINHSRVKMHVIHNEKRFSVTFCSRSYFCEGECGRERSSYERACLSTPQLLVPQQHLSDVLSSIRELQTTKPFSITNQKIHVQPRGLNSYSFQTGTSKKVIWRYHFGIRPPNSSSSFRFFNFEKTLTEWVLVFSISRKLWRSVEVMSDNIVNASWCLSLWKNVSRRVTHSLRPIIYTTCVRSNVNSVNKLRNVRWIPRGDT